MRKVLLPTVIFISTILLVLRLFYLQVIDDTLKLKSDNNAIKIAYDYPERGYIYDRNGKLLVANQPSYDIMVIPKDIKNIDTAEFCSLLKITKEDFMGKLTKNEYKRYFTPPKVHHIFTEVRCLGMGRRSRFELHTYDNYEYKHNK